MADKEVGFKINVKAVVDEKSAKVASNKLIEDVLGALKNGCIEIPTAVKVPFDKNKSSDKLIKAQKDFLNQWNKMSSKGFSSSKDDLDDLRDDLDDLSKKHTTFKRLMSKEGKSNSKQNNALTKSSEIGSILRAYERTKSILNQKIDQLNLNVTKTQRISSKATRRKGKTDRNPQFEHSIEEINSNINDKNKRNGMPSFSKKLLKGTSAHKAATPGAEINLGYASQAPWEKNAITTEKTLMANERSFYEIKGSAEEKRQMKLAEKESKKTLVKHKDKDYVEEVAQKADRKSKSTRDRDARKINFDTAIKDVKKFIVDIERKSEVPNRGIYDVLDIAIKAGRNNGKSYETISKAISGTIQSIYTQSMKKKIGGATRPRKRCRSWSYNCTKCSKTNTDNTRNFIRNYNTFIN